MHVAVVASAENGAVLVDVARVMLPQVAEHRARPLGQPHARRVGAEQYVPHPARDREGQPAGLATPPRLPRQVRRLDVTASPLPVDVRHLPRPTREEQYPRCAHGVCEQASSPTEPISSRPEKTVNSGAAVNTAISSMKCLRPKWRSADGPMNASPPSVSRKPSSTT